MKYEDITPLMRKFIGNREALRRLGFSPDDLFLMTARSVLLGGRVGAFVSLRSQGKEFNLELGPIEAEPGQIKERTKDLAAEYVRVAQAINDGQVSNDDLDRILREAEAYERTIDLIVALKAKGFRLRDPSVS